MSLRAASASVRASPGAGVPLALRFFVPGVPVPGGSKRGFIIRGKGKPARIAMTDASGQRGKDWRASVQHAAAQALGSGDLLDGALHLDVTFTMPRPRSHYGRRKGADVLKMGAPHYHTSAPDTTKLVRAIEDAMNGVALSDDSRIAVQIARKVYGPKPGAEIFLSRLSQSGASP